jgi:sorbitol-specific phosphotransferase system component IIBC
LSDEGIEQRQRASGAVTQLLKQLSSAVNSAQAVFDHKNRQVIVYCVIGIYVFVVGITALYLVICATDINGSVFAGLSELLKVGVIPIVTLVIGYYFGAKTHKN